MAWLQSSFTSHQLLRDSSGGNLRKGYKVGTVNKNSDPDKSDTPLLCDSSQSPESESSTPDWFQTSSSITKKQNAPPSAASKSSFLPSGIFDRSGCSSKLKSQNSPSDASQPGGCSKKPTENKKLLSDDGKKKNPLFEDDDDDDSEDEWCIPHSGGYQRVRPGAD